MQLNNTVLYDTSQEGILNSNKILTNKCRNLIDLQFYYQKLANYNVEGCGITEKES